MKKLLGMFVLVGASLSINSANAAAKKYIQTPKSSGNNAAFKCSATYCVKVALSKAVGAKGTLTVFKKDANKTYQPANISCNVIGGNPTIYPKNKAIYTPAGVYGVYKHTNPLIYSESGDPKDRKPDNGFNYASYFMDPGAPSGNEVAIHTAPDYSTNSHGCVRAPCAQSVYNLQGDVEVQVDYL